MTRKADAENGCPRPANGTAVWVYRLAGVVALGFGILMLLSLWFDITLIMNGRAKSVGLFTFMLPIFCAVGGLWMLFLRAQVAKHAFGDQDGPPTSDRV